MSQRLNTFRELLNEGDADRRKRLIGNMWIYYRTGRAIEGEVEIISILETVLRREVDPETRVQVIDGLGHFGHINALSVLRRAVYDPSPQVSAAVIRATQARVASCQQRYLDEGNREIIGSVLIQAKEIVAQLMNAPDPTLRYYAREHHAEYEHHIQQFYGQ